MDLNTVNRLLSIITIGSLALLGCEPPPGTENEPPGGAPTTYAGTFEVINPSYTISGSVLWTESSSSSTVFIASGEAQVDYNGCAPYSGKRPIHYDAASAGGNGKLSFVSGGYSWNLAVEPFEVSCNGQTVPVNFGPLTPCNAASFPGAIAEAKLSGSGSCGTETYTWTFTKGR